MVKHLTSVWPGVGYVISFSSSRDRQADYPIAHEFLETSRIPIR